MLLVENAMCVGSQRLARGLRGQGSPSANQTTVASTVILLT